MWATRIGRWEYTFGPGKARRSERVMFARAYRVRGEPVRVECRGVVTCGRSPRVGLDPPDGVNASRVPRRGRFAPARNEKRGTPTRRPGGGCGLIVLDGRT